MTVERPGLFDLQVNGFGGIDLDAADPPADRLLWVANRRRRSASIYCR
jgi:hypothetical protein